ncbi:hypothetical protein [Limnohabitans sp. 2KL-3]|uniref:hypothetical protein n=1 Tax=Limnohabitans sp. 2KL-3 TaxID=1100700 RepID=UPI000A80B760|nr:hypothetical protein [Limnohabitans sp. 2KL-3]
MANLRMGYIGKSFSMGVLGIVGTLVACGGGGITSTVANVVAPSEHVLFAMGYSVLPFDANDPDLKYSTKQGGKVHIGSGGGWSYGGFGIFQQTDNRFDIGQGAIDFFGGGGVLFKHLAALTNDSYIYYKVTPRTTGSVDISATDNLLISLGNDKIGSAANTHKEVTVFLEGGTASGFNYSNSCKSRISLRDKDNNNNITTYAVSLASFTCDSGSLTNLKSSLNQVVVKVLPGDNNLPSDAASGDSTETLITLGPIAFSKN